MRGAFECDRPLPPRRAARALRVGPRRQAGAVSHLPTYLHGTSASSHDGCAICNLLADALCLWGPQGLALPYALPQRDSAAVAVTAAGDARTRLGGTARVHQCWMGLRAMPAI